MIVTYRDNYFVVHCAASERAPARAAGFKWHGELKALVSNSAQVASRLSQYADESAKEKILKAFIQVKPWTGRIPFPQGLRPLPFQPGAAHYALARNRSYLALDPGLGKTIVAALIANALGRHSIVFVCPPFLALNTREEFTKWCVWKPTIRIWPDTAPADILIVPDSLIADPLGGLELAIRRMLDECPTLIVDEAHRYKNGDAQRTRALHRISDLFDRVVLLSGTPMPNRPLELYATLNKFAPETIDFKSYNQFGMRYCAGFYNGIGYDFRGASNVAELAPKVRGTFMLRLRKKDVLRDLPPKTEELIFLAEDLPPTLAAMERAELAHHSPQDLMAEELGNVGLSRYRHKLGLAKAPLAVSFIKDLLSESDESVIIFAEHLEVIARLAKGLAKFNPVVITGKVDKHLRQGMVADFQRDKDKRVFIGNIRACGVGFNITKASRVVFAEFSWVPGDNDQASDRAHRHGQKNPVFVQYLVFKNSIDRAVMESNLRKRKTINIL